MGLLNRLKIARDLWAEAKELDRIGVLARGYPSIKSGTQGLPKGFMLEPGQVLGFNDQPLEGDGKAEILPDMTESDHEEYLDDQAGWSGFKQKIKETVNKILP